MILSELLKNVRSLAIGGHTRPDGDCAGSAMGLGIYLRENYPDLSVHIYLEEIPSSFQTLGNVDIIKHEAGQGENYDLFIALDCGDSARLGFAEELFHLADKTACIDHHISNQGFAVENYIMPRASSTSELIYNLLDPDLISPVAAAWLYLGIVHDTGVFRYTAAKPSTMEAAAVLMRKGIDAAGIIERTYYDKTHNQMRVLGYALLNSRLYLDGRCISAVLTWEEQQNFSVGPSELEGIASQLKNTRGAEMVLFLYQQSAGDGQTGDYKASLRSGPTIDVSRIAVEFGGGGHKKASGFQMTGSPEEIICAVMKLAAEQLNKG